MNRVGRSWLQRAGVLQDVSQTLCCLPFAGGSASAYHPWRRCLPADWELVAVQLPGRQESYGVPPLRALSPLVAELTNQLGDLLARGTYVLFGHSMGALLAFETTRELRRRGLQPPVLLAVSGARAPHRRTTGTAHHQMSDDELVTAIRSLGNLPPELADDREFLDFFLPTVRADFEVAETYQYVPEEPLDIPLLVFGGTEDRLTPPDELCRWSEASIAEVAVRTFPGDHFFLNDHYESIVIDIVARGSAADTPSMLSPGHP